jgi:glucokinase
MAKQEKQYTIGIDVGGTKMSAVLFDGQKVIADYTLATPADNLESFMVMLKALVEPLVEKAKEDKVKIKGVGLGAAGVIDYQEGRMLTSPNIPIIDGVKIADELAARIELPIVMDNDTNCFLRAEMKAGAGRNYQNAYGIIIGTGIGGAWWYNNKVYKGAYGGAGEPGHMIIDTDSGLDLESTYHKLAQNNPGKLAQEAYRGDPLAEKTFSEIGNILGIAFANIVNIIDPEVMIIGGGVVESSDLFLSKAKKVMRKYINSSESRKNVKIVKSKIGPQAGAIGAAMLIV